MGRTLRDNRDEARTQARTLLDCIVREMAAGDCNWQVVERDAHRLARLANDASRPVTVGEILARY